MINYKTMSSADFVDPAHRLCELYRKINHVDVFGKPDWLTYPSTVPSALASPGLLSYLSGVVRGPSVVSTTNTARRLAGRVRLAFSLMPCAEPGSS